MWGIAVYGAATGTHQKLDQKYPGSFVMCFMIMMGKIIWTDRVKIEEVLHRAQNEGNIIHIVWRRNVCWIGHVLRRNCVLKVITVGEIEGRAEVTGRRRRRRWRRRRRRRRTQLLADLNERGSCRKPKQDARDRAVWGLALEEMLDHS